MWINFHKVWLFFTEMSLHACILDIKQKIDHMADDTPLELIISSYIYRIDFEGIKRKGRSIEPFFFKFNLGGTRQHF